MLGPQVSLPIFAGGRLAIPLNCAMRSSRKPLSPTARPSCRPGTMSSTRWSRTGSSRTAAPTESAGRHSRAALGLARTRYSDGVVDFLTVLDAERTLLQAEQQYATSTTNV